MKRALITGITGQDGSYLTELLLAKGYEVHGVVRRSSSFNTERLDHLYRDPHESGVRLHLHYGDLNDASSLQSIVSVAEPDEIYNLGAQSHVRVSFEIPEYTGEVTGLGAVRLLETVRKLGVKCKFYQASSSELYGKVVETPQKETARFIRAAPTPPQRPTRSTSPRTTARPTGSSPATGSSSTTRARGAASIVTRKITRAVGRIKLGVQKELFLGNLDAKRDWGHARDYVEAMWLMLQTERPDDYVIGTGETHSVREFLNLAFGHAGLDWKNHVRIDEKYLRPAEVDLLLSDPSKAKRELGWTPKVGFHELVKEMVDADVELAEREKRAKG